MSDTDFMSKIIKEICDYAVINKMNPDETIKTIAQNLLCLLEISTFNHWKVEYD